jgi:hypothetical protein
MAQQKYTSVIFSQVKWVERLYSLIDMYVFSIQLYKATLFNTLKPLPVKHFRFILNEMIKYKKRMLKNSSGESLVDKLIFNHELFGACLSFFR